VSSGCELDASKALQKNIGALEKGALFLSDGLEFIVTPDSKAIEVGAGIGDDGADCHHQGLVYFGHDVKYRERVFSVHLGVAITKEAVLAFQDVAGFGVFFDPIRNGGFNLREDTRAGVTGGGLFIQAGGREVLQNEAAVFGFFHNSRAKGFVAGDDDEVILVLNPLEGLTLVPDEVASAGPT
jgi:hypothetical protein